MCIPSLEICNTYIVIWMAISREEGESEDKEEGQHITGCNIVKDGDVSATSPKCKSD